MFDFKLIAEQILSDIKAELRAQGHYDTGELEQSMRVFIMDEINEEIVQAHALGYIEDLEYGVKAKDIKVSKAEFEDIRGWVMRKIGVDTATEATSIAAAIVKKWKKEGKPLAGSKQYSKTGEVLEAVRIGFEKNEQQWSDKIDSAIFNTLDDEFKKTRSSTI